jgi:hypothetical protein
MGGVLSSVPNIINIPQTRSDAHIHSVKGSELLPNGTYSVHRLNELQYQTCWDWLMPVIKKIKGLNLVEYTAVDEIDFYLSGVSLEHTHSAVVRFIKWYNEE